MSSRSLFVAFTLAGLCAATGAQQQVVPAEWQSPRLSTDVSVMPAKDASQYVIRAKVVDLASSKVLATPTLLTRAGQPTTFEMGHTGAVTLRMTFEVSPDGRSAAYTSEIQRQGVVESSQRATLLVGT